MSPLRQAREEQGLSLEELERQTRIPLVHLEAIEEDRLDDLPEGPYREGWLRAVHHHLGVPMPDNPSEEVEAPGRQLWVVRGITTALAVALAGLAVYTWQLTWQDDETDRVAVVAPPDQHVSIVAQRSTRLVVRVDGEVAFDDELPGGQKREFSGHDRVEVELEAADRAKVLYNGDRIVPQGRQDRPRTLVFHDDRHN